MILIHLFSGYVSTITNKFIERIIQLASSLYTYKYAKCLSFSNTKFGLKNICKDLLVAPIKKASSNLARLKLDSC